MAVCVMIGLIFWIWFTICCCSTYQGEPNICNKELILLILHKMANNNDRKGKIAWINIQKNSPKSASCVTAQLTQIEITKKVILHQHRKRLVQPATSKTIVTIDWEIP
jgi:hypothetical protein